MKRRLSQRDLEVLKETEAYLRAQADEAAGMPAEPGRLEISPDAVERLRKVPPIVRERAGEPNPAARAGLRAAGTALHRLREAAARNSRVTPVKFAADSCRIAAYLVLFLAAIGSGRRAAAARALARLTSV